MNKITATYRIVTPMFIGGADQTPSDGIRPPSVKGVLRFWWRALNWGKFRSTAPDDAVALQELHKEEARLFGVAADDNRMGGQGCFLLKVSHNALRSTSKQTVHQSFRTKDAARYLGYGLMATFGANAGQLQRGCINEDQEFTVSLIFRRGIEASVREAVIAWGLMGGLGSRSRRGMGSVALISLTDGATEWAAPNDEEGYVAGCRSLFSSSSGPATLSRLPAAEPPFSAFWEQSRVDCLMVRDTPYKALDGFGNAMLMYRSWGSSPIGNRLPGGVSEKRFVADHNWCRDTRPAGFHPKRVVFGLPHNYGQPANQKVNGAKHERRSSPLLFHVHRLNDHKYLGVSVYLPSQFLPDGERINAGGANVTASIDWSVITGFLDGKVGNPPTPEDRFPGRTRILP